MITTKCAICGSKQKISNLYQANFDIKKITKKTFSARRTPDRVHYRFDKCTICGLIFSNPILEPEKIYKFYFGSDFTYNEESKYLMKTYRGYLEKCLPKKGLNKTRLLDIGCGNGFFLQEVQRIGIKDVWGIEPGKEIFKKTSPELRLRIKNDILRRGVFKPNHFDIVCCFHTLDHIVDPNTFLQVVYELLKKGGKALFIVHDANGLSVKLLGEKSPIFDIEHIYLFNKFNLDKIFLKNGFIQRKIFEVWNAYPLSYWMRMFPMQKGVKNFLIKLIGFVGLKNLTIKINAGNIGIYATKK